eukprot:1116147-Amphidinium_carterae.2
MAQHYLPRQEVKLPTRGGPYGSRGNPKAHWENIQCTVRTPQPYAKGGESVTLSHCMQPNIFTPTAWSAKSWRHEKPLSAWAHSSSTQALLPVEALTIETMHPPKCC